MFMRLGGKLPALRASVASVNTKVRTRYVQAGIACEEHGRAHEILGTAHLTHRNERCPLALELWVFVEDLFSPVRE